MRTRVVLLAILAVGCATTGENLAPDAGVLAPLIEPIRAAHGVPGMGAAILDANGLVAAGAAGTRKAGGQQAVTVNDLWHLGSDTKAMTATLVGMFVDEG